LQRRKLRQLYLQLKRPQKQLKKRLQKQLKKKLPPKLQKRRLQQPH
jgi:hypothetical protein